MNAILSPVVNAVSYAGRRLAARNDRKYVARNSKELLHLPTGPERFKIALYFADEMVNAYQIRQWYEPMRLLAEEYPVMVITRRPDTALALLEECPLPVHYAPTIDDVEAVVSSQDLRVVFYVNQNIRNFQMMRFESPDHVFICHGESEKAYMWSNQLKAYDYVFSAGQAAADRLRLHLRHFNVDERVKLIGRPQIDAKYLIPYSFNQSLPTVLYAPTWEGDRASMNYGSAATHGEQLVDALIHDGGFNLVFRPHPRSGINSSAYRNAVRRLKSLIHEADQTSSARLVVDEGAQWGWQCNAADICIADVSAVAYDFLATGKPIFIAQPEAQSATMEDSPALSRLPLVDAKEAREIASLLRHAMATQDSNHEQLVAHYFGDVTPGASMSRFLDTVRDLVK